TPVAVTTVTLALSPEQAERLTLAQTEGRIVLATRNYQDKAIVKTSGATRQGLLAGGEAAPATVAKVVSAKRATPAPIALAPLPPPKLETHTVAVLRAGKVSEQHVFVRSDGPQQWTEQTR